MHIFAILGKTYFMMNFKDKLKDLFVYKPNMPYEFVLSENNASDENPPANFLPDGDVFSTLDENYDYLRVQLNSLINSDVIMRPFTINVSGKAYNALFVGIDGMISSSLVNNFLLRPLLNTNTNSTQSKVQCTKNGVQFKKIKKVNLDVP